MRTKCEVVQTQSAFSPRAELIDGGELKTRVRAILPLADARGAHMMEGLRPSPGGKIILNVEAADEATQAG
jgi:hypothetical protein